MIYHLGAIILAVILDYFIGDPPRLPHPVKGFGKLINYFDTKWNHGSHRKLKGYVMVIILIVFILCLSVGLILLAYLIHPVASFVLETLLIATTIAQKGLRDAAIEVKQPLENGDKRGAREKLSYIVGRDTDDLEENDVIRGTIETVAENTSDGITAPLFWALIGGAPLALVYRLINTCDSMVGYKNTTYQDFGYASAKLDDFVNWLPARLTGCLMLVSYRSSVTTLKQAWSILRRDATKHPSPNSGWGEAAVAALLGVQLGGINYYQGEASHRMEMGDPLVALRVIHIDDALKMMERTVILFVLSLMLGGVIIEFTFTWF